MAESPARLEFYPFAYALFTEELENYCWYCVKPCPLKRHCIGCGFAIFCNKDCQTFGWKDHKAECKGFRNVDFIPDIEARLLGRIVLRHKMITTGKDIEDADFYQDRKSQRQILDIWAHTEKMKEDNFALKKFEDIYGNLVKFYDKKFLLDKDTVFELHCRNYINRHAISDRGYVKEIGKGLYLDLCAYDHSCAPNTIYTCDGFKATLRRLNNNVNLLDKSTTFYSYIELLCSQQQRRKLLRDTWYFTCECSRCMDSKDHLLTSIVCPKCPADERVEVCIFGPNANKDSITQMVSCDKCKEEISQDYVLEAVGAMRFIDRIFEDKEIEQMPGKAQIPFLQDLLARFRPILPQINVYYCRIIQDLIPRLPPSDNKELLRLHLLAEQCVRHSFPHNHPAVAFHLRNIAIFYSNLGKRDESMKYFAEAQEIMDYTLDADHTMSVENRQLWEEAKVVEKPQPDMEKLKKLSLKEKSQEDKPKEYADESDEEIDDMPALINE